MSVDFREWIISSSLSHFDMVYVRKGPLTVLRPVEHRCDLHPQPLACTYLQRSVQCTFRTCKCKALLCITWFVISSRELCRPRRGVSARPWEQVPIGDLSIRRSQDWPCVGRAAHSQHYRHPTTDRYNVAFASRWEIFEKRTFSGITLKNHSVSIATRKAGTFVLKVDGPKLSVIN